MVRDTGEMARWLRGHWLLLQRTWVSLPRTYVTAHSHVTPAPGDLMPFSGLYGHYTHAVHMHALTQTNTHTHKSNKEKISKYSLKY